MVLLIFPLITFVTQNLEEPNKYLVLTLNMCTSPKIGFLLKIIQNEISVQFPNMGMGA